MSSKILEDIIRAKEEIKIKFGNLENPKALVCPVNTASNIELLCTIENKEVKPILDYLDAQGQFCGMKIFPLEDLKDDEILIFKHEVAASNFVRMIQTMKKYNLPVRGTIEAVIQAARENDEENKANPGEGSSSL